MDLDNGGITVPQSSLIENSLLVAVTEIPRVTRGR